MAMLTLRCPHCDKDRMTFDVGARLRYYGKAQIDGRRRYVAAAFCRACKLPISFVALLPGDRALPYGVDVDDLLLTEGDVTSYFVVEDMWPIEPTLEAPSATPAEVERLWIEAEKSRRHEANVAATMMYRLTLETALEAVHPSEGRKLRLFDAINAAAAAQKITPDLRDWAHHIRLVGNEAAHEGGSPAEIAELANLTEMVLVYLFELPDKVRRMREAADARKAEGAA